MFGNSYNMGCLPARRNNLRVLAGRLSYVQDNHGITILYTSRDILF